MLSRSLLILAVTASLAIVASTRADDNIAEDELPVILLTGFEPFAERSPNPAWEGIKQLDGQERHGHLIVARQMRCVWGQPLAQLAEWIEEHEPVAVLSFGRGGDGFTIETRAANRRGGGRDNDDREPPSPTIVEGAPEEYRATIDARRIAELLAKRDHPIRRSDDAGAYLCEECLYSLEHLKAEKKLAGQVAFCHVPPLGSQSRGKPVWPKRFSSS